MSTDNSDEPAQKLPAREALPESQGVACLLGFAALLPLSMLAFSFVIPNGINIYSAVFLCLMAGPTIPAATVMVVLLHDPISRMLAGLGGLIVLLATLNLVAQSFLWEGEWLSGDAILYYGLTLLGTLLIFSATLWTTLDPSGRRRIR